MTFLLPLSSFGVLSFPLLSFLPLKVEWVSIATIICFSSLVSLALRLFGSLHDFPSLLFAFLPLVSFPSLSFLPLKVDWVSIATFPFLSFLVSFSPFDC